MNQQLDDSKESAQSQSMERYLQADSPQNSVSPKVQTCRVGASILKLQNGKYSSQTTVFKDALNKRKNEINKKAIKAPIEQPKYERAVKEKKPMKMDKLEQNIKNVQLKGEEVKKKKEEEKQKEEKLKQSKIENQKEDVDQAFEETVNRLYDYEKRRIKQLQKLVEEDKARDKQKNTARPVILEKSCKMLDKKLKQLVEEEDDYKHIYQFKDADVQVDLMPNLPKLKDFFHINAKKLLNSSLDHNIQIIRENNQKEVVEVAQDVQYKNDQCHQIVQTNEIKFKVGDTIKKEQQQQPQQQTTQFTAQETPNKKVVNQRQKRLEIMEGQGQRVKTECQYYVPIHLRQQKVIQKKDEWVKSQIELQKQKQEESQRLEREEWEKERQKWGKKKDKSMQQEIDAEEFAHQQISWLEKRNEHILTEQMKKDKEMQSSLTFKPTIQKRNLDNYNSGGKVEDRLLEYQQKKQENLQKLENKYLPTFHPNLQQKSLMTMDWASKSFTNTSFNKLWQ